jgi:hypothetical protein
MPPLAGAKSALAGETTSKINITLNGSQRVVWGNCMPLDCPCIAIDHPFAFDLTSRLHWI